MNLLVLDFRIEYLRDTLMVMDIVLRMLKLLVELYIMDLVIMDYLIV